MFGRKSNTDKERLKNERTGYKNEKIAQKNRNQETARKNREAWGVNHAIMIIDVSPEITPHTPAGRKKKGKMTRPRSSKTTTRKSTPRTPAARKK